jgi:hypothetical protein
LLNLENTLIAGESLTRRETGPGELKDRQRRWEERPGSRSEALSYDKV